MRMIRALMGVAVAVLLASSSAAAATPMDATETTAFVAAAIRLDGQAVARYGREKAAANALIKHLRLTCPRAIPASLRTGTRAQGRVLTAFISALGGELVLAEVRPLRPAAEAAIEVFSHLRWSDASLNQAVRRYVRETRATLSLRSPDLCVAVNVAKASGFSTVPSQMTKFLRGLRQAVGRDSSLIALASRMKMYVRPAENGNLKHLRTLDRRFTGLLARFNQGTYGRIVSALFA